MPALELLPFADEHVEPAAALLAERHARHRAAEPLLPDVTDFRAQVERDWGAEGASGAVALAGDEVVGYLVGSKLDDGIGPTVRIAIAGFAVREPEVARDLYAAAAPRWVEEGVSRHYVFVPALPELVDPWFRLCFGASAALAARETAVEEARVEGVRVRAGTEGDLEAAAGYDRLLWQHLSGSPSFSRRQTAPEDEFVEDWRGTWDDPQFTHFVAERDGRIVGHLLLYRRPEGDLRVPPRSIDLANAATDPEARGSGAGLALTAHALTWAKEHGIETMITDWRMTNLLASRFWPRRGFRETFLRLYRSIP
jgi:ribosomal protein S18 acetylase RimI-like enzyme